MLVLVFVYGTLLSGESNHDLLLNSRYLGEHKTEAEYTLFNYGPYPAVIIDGTISIHGEVYEVDEQTFKALDRLEGYPNFYDRKLITTPYGEAWMYCHTNVIPSGNWRERDAHI